MKSLMSSLGSFWKALEVNQKLSLSMAALVVLGGMIALVLWAQQPNLRLLYGSLSEGDAAAIVNHLETQGIPYEIRNGGSAVYVPEQDVYRARMDVVSNGVIQGDSVGFEIFDKNSFGASDFIQRTNFIRAVQGELARTISQLNGVQSARVMVVVPDNRLLMVNSDIQTTASVFVDIGAKPLRPEAVRSIQALVSNSVEGLDFSNVAVVDSTGRVLSTREDSESPFSGSDRVLEYRQKSEAYFSEKVQSMLETVVGKGNAIVRVFADIDSEQLSRTEERFDESSAVLRSVSTREESRTSVQAVAAEGGEGEGAGGSPSQTEEEKRNKDQEYEIDRTVTNTVRVPGTITRLTASVFVAAKVTPPEEEGGEATVVSRTPEELNQLEQMVANALGIDLTNSGTGTVTVQETVFSNPTPEVDVFPGPTSGFEWVQLLRYGEEITGTIVAIILFTVFLVLYRRFKSEPTPFEELNQQVSTARGDIPLDSSNVTPELLNELIRQKPDNAAISLRNWLSDSNSSDS